MGKVRHVIIGDASEEQEQKKKAEARREAKKAKKQKDETSPEETSPDSAALETQETEKSEHKKEKKTSDKQPKIKSKKYQEVAKLVDKNHVYSLKEALELVKKTSITKFDGTVEIHVNLNALTLAGKTEFRGTAHLPHGTGKEVRVAIANDELLKDMEAGTFNFDILIAHPSMMPKLAKYARVLGPKGLMPNPKNGTVSPDPEKRANELKGGEVNFKTEPNNLIIHMGIGKVSFESKQLQENLEALFLAIGKNKILSATLSSTMGPGIKVNVTA